MTIFDVFHPALGETHPLGNRAFRARRPAFRATASTASAGVHPTARRETGPDVLRRYRDYRTAFARAGIACAAQDLLQRDVATGVRKRGYLVDVHSCEELANVLSAGIPASRIVVHDDGITAAPIRRAINAGVGRLILGCHHQVGVVTAGGGRPPRILVDVTTGCADGTIADVLDRPQLDLIGLHAHWTPETHRRVYADTVAQMIAQMSHVRREHGIILTQVSLAGGEVLSDSNSTMGVLRELAAELDDAFDEACARYRYPRPAVTLAPR